ncbi:LOW QUALITY PROTEIN: hypothetical protein CsSME_00016336 [Camellia sinensis var. sinensis]
MGLAELNHRLRINLGIPVIRHCYALAKSSGRQGRYFLRAKDIDHHLVTMLASSGKFDEGEDRLDPVPRQKNKLDGCNDLKKTLTLADDAVLEQVKKALKFFGCSNIQKSKPPPPAPIEEVKQETVVADSVIIQHPTDSVIDQLDDHATEQKGGEAPRRGQGRLFWRFNR